jgi:hypothetical protein
MRPMGDLVPCLTGRTLGGAGDTVKCYLSLQCAPDEALTKDPGDQRHTQGDMRSPEGDWLP